MKIGLRLGSIAYVWGKVSSVFYLGTGLEGLRKEFQLRHNKIHYQRDLKEEENRKLIYQLVLGVFWVKFNAVARQSQIEEIYSVGRW